MDLSAFISSKFNKFANLNAANTFQTLPNGDSSNKKLDPDIGCMETKPEYLHRFNPLNKTFHQVVEKRSSSSATDKVANSMSTNSLGYGEEGGSCTKSTKRKMGRGRGRRRAIPEDDTYRQTESSKSGKREIDYEDEERARVNNYEVKEGQESSEYFHGFLSLEHYLKDLKIAKERESNRNMGTLNYKDDDENENLDHIESYVFLSEKSTIIQDIDSDVEHNLLV